MGSMVHYSWVLGAGCLVFCVWCGMLGVGCLLWVAWKEALGLELMMLGAWCASACLGRYEFMGVWCGVIGVGKERLRLGRTVEKIPER